MTNHFDWFDRSIYQDRYDKDYWSQMISERLWCNAALESSSPLSEQAKKGALNRFHSTLEDTGFREDDPESYRNSLLAFRRSIANSNRGSPPAFVMRLEDLITNSEWMNHSDSAREALELRKAHSDKWTPKYFRVNGRLMSEKPPKREGNRLQEFKDMHALMDQPLTSFPGYKELADRARYLPVMINLHKSDKEIMASIKKVRDSIQISPATGTRNEYKFHSSLEKEIARWITFGVLPYFDIKFYSRVTGFRISNKDVADLIWPVAIYPHTAHLNPIERLKQSTIPYCKKVFRKETLSILE